MGMPLDQLHHEVGPAGVGGAGLEHLGDVGVVHHRQRLPLGLEAGDHLPRVHARLDDLERHPAADGAELLGHEHDAHAPLADLFQQLVRADHRPRTLRRLPPGAAHCAVGGARQGHVGRRRLQEAAGPFVRRQQYLHPRPQLGAAAAGAVQECGALVRASLSPTPR